MITECFVSATVVGHAEPVRCELLPDARRAGVHPVGRAVAAVAGDVCIGSADVPGGGGGSV